MDTIINSTLLGNEIIRGVVLKQNGDISNKEAGKRLALQLNRSISNINNEFVRWKIAEDAGCYPVYQSNYTPGDYSVIFRLF